MFGMGFTEILIIAVIAIIFLGPDKLPTAMVEIAKFFRNAKKTIGTVKDSIEEEINIKDIKQDALAYKKELLDVSNELKKTTDSSQINSKLTEIGDGIINDIKDEDISKESITQEEVTFKKKESKNKKEEKVKDTSKKDGS